MAFPTAAKLNSRRRVPYRASLDLYNLLLAGLILLYTAIFTRLAFAQHAGMRTHKADLGQIAQAVWNSSRGRFVEMTDNGFIATRMTDHVEPILALISPVLWVWNDVRALLLLQVAVAALGAWPLYELAVTLLERAHPDRESAAGARRPHCGWIKVPALALATAYLLLPQLQSAVLTEFHAAPLAVLPVLWAFWAVETRHWGQVASAVVLTALVKEEMALLAAGLGLWAAWRGGVLARLERRRHEARETWLPLLLGSGLALAALVWFYLATFIIVPAHAVEVYGVAESSYFRRYGALGDSPADILRNLATQPGLVWSIVGEPARWAYLIGLAAPLGFLALLAPEAALLCLPVLLANLLSAYPAQYYGEFHYSAPVVVYFAAATAFGMARVWRLATRRLTRSSPGFQHLPAFSPTTMAAAALLQNSRTALRPLLAFLLALWLLGWAVQGYGTAGRGPGGGRYDPTPVTAHHRLLARFTAQLPAGAAVTATAAVHPHVSLRRYVYQFPIGLEPPGRADWALLDVTTATDMAPGDVRATVEAMLAGEWGVVDGADGFLLLAKGAANKQIPPAFYDFARTPGAVETDAPLTFTGVELADWPRWRQSWVTTHWMVGEDFDPARMAPALALRDPAGDLLYRWADAMPPALVWYPPDQWQPGDRLHLTTLPLYLPQSWGVVVERTPGLVWPPQEAIVVGEQAALVGLYRRDSDGVLLALDEQLHQRAWPVAQDTARTAARFDLGNGEQLALAAWLPAAERWPGAPLDLWLRWEGAAWPAGADVFVHLRRDGETQDQQDGAPRLVIPYSSASLQTDPWLDWRQMRVPVDAAPGEWTLAVGLYHPASGERLPLAGGPGTEVIIPLPPPRDPPVADQTCALIPASCASQP
ncbi:MAG TPA: DUF2079 domain-containing protein [Caldilineaceae bacterium]|nr:DUF2079 domain-containing protein [Caldilineaceae bacterium]